MQEKTLKNLVIELLIDAEINEFITSDLYAEVDAQRESQYKVNYSDTEISLINDIDFWMRFSFTSYGDFRYSQEIDGWDAEITNIEFDIRNISLYVMEEDFDFSNDKDIKEVLLKKLNEL